MSIWMRSIWPGSRTQEGDYMLGWQVYVLRQTSITSSDKTPDKVPTIASWETSLGGLDWLEALVKEG